MEKKKTHGNTAKRRRKRLKRRLRLFGIVFFIGLFAFSLYKLIGAGVTYIKNRNAYENIRDAAATFREAPVVTPEIIDNGPEEPEATPEPLPFYPDWAQLKTVCPDIIGWLYLEGTNIHYPVVQGDDNAFYLDHNARQEKNAGGALFLDKYCGKNSRNLIIYGHRMKDDSMFGQLPNYAEKSYLNAHPVMYYLTPAQNYRVQIYACRTVKAEGKYFATEFESEDGYRNYQEKAVEQSYWAAPVSPDPQYKTLTLSTCSVYRGINDPRLLVHGLLIPMH